MYTKSNNLKNSDMTKEARIERITERITVIQERINMLESRNSDKTLITEASANLNRAQKRLAKVQAK